MKINNYDIIDSSIMYKILMDLNAENKPNLRGLIWGNCLEVISFSAYKVYEYLQNNSEFIKYYNNFRKEFNNTKDLMEITDILNSKSADEFTEKISDILDAEEIRNLVIHEIHVAKEHIDEVESFYNSIYQDNE